MNLTTHFTLEELIASDTANARGIDNTPPAEVITALKRTAELLEDVRRVLGGKPITVSSGYRCAELNQAVGGVPDSAHVLGCAADILCPAFGSPLEVCRAIVAAHPQILFDQLIREHIGADWTHIAWAPSPRRQVLTIDHAGTRLGLGE